MGICFIQYAKKRSARVNALIRKYGFPINERNLLQEDYAEYDLLKPELEAMKQQELARAPMPHGSSLDDEDMDRNAEIVKAHRNAETQTDEEAQLLRRIRENSKKQSLTSSQREKREREIMDQVDNEVDNWSDDDWKNYIKKQSSTEQKAYKALQYSKEYRILAKNKAKMELAGKRIVNEFGSGAADGIDNLYHRRGMYEIGQLLHTGNLHSAQIGALLGVAKESVDIISKISKGQPVSDVLLDSLKDMNNNAEGLRDGTFHLKSSRDYYKDFDYKRNRKKK